MTQEQKDLLIKDLCARLPYGVKCCIYNFGEDTIRIKEDILWSVQGDNILTLKSCVEKGEAYMFHQIKPYLFPFSSMTEDQKYEFYLRFIAKDCDFDYFKFYLDNGKWHKLITSLLAVEEIIDWFNKNHIDYRGLIEKGLAIDATNKDIY